MDSSDEEIFDATPNYVLANENRINDNPLIKDITVKLTRLSDHNMQNKQTGTRMKNTRSYKWKHGIIRKRKKLPKKNSKKSQIEAKKVKPNETTVLDKVDNDKQHTFMCENMKEDNLEIYGSAARTIPYLWKNTSASEITSNDGEGNCDYNTIKLDKWKSKRKDKSSDESSESVLSLPIVKRKKRYMISSSSNNSSDNEITAASSTTLIRDSEQSDCCPPQEIANQEKSQSKIFLRELRISLTRLEDMNINTNKSIQKYRLKEQQSQVIISSDEEVSTSEKSSSIKEQSEIQFILERFRRVPRRRKINLMKGDDSSKTPDIYDVSSDSSRTELCEDSSDSSRTEELREDSPDSSRTEELREDSPDSSKTEELREDSLDLSKTEELHEYSPDSSKTEELREDSPDLSKRAKNLLRKPIGSAKANRPTELSNALDTTSSKKKYNLFKEPFVRLTNIRSIIFSDYRKSNKLIDKYTNSRTIESSSLNSKSCYSSSDPARLQRKRTTDSNTVETDDDASSTEHETPSEIVDSKATCFESFLKTDDHAAYSESDMNSCVRNPFSKITPKTKCNKSKSENKCISPRTRLDIWRKAFCRSKSLERLCETTTKQFTSLISASTSSNEDNTTLVKRISPRGHASTRSLDCKNRSASQSSSNLQYNANAEEIASENYSSRPEGNVVSKSPRNRSAVEKTKIIMSNSSDSSDERIENISLKSPEKTINNTTSVKSKTTDHSPSGEKASVGGALKCIICNGLYKNKQALYNHLANDPCKLRYIYTSAESHIATVTTSKVLEAKKVLDKIYRYSVQTSIQHFSSDAGSRVTREPGKEVALLSSPSNNEKRSKTLQNSKAKDTFIKRKSLRSKSIDLGVQSRAEIVKIERFRNNLYEGEKITALTCKICLQTFRNYFEMSRHMLQHTDREIQNAYIMVKDNTIFTNQESDKNNDRLSENVGKDSMAVTRNNEQKVVPPLRNVNESNIPAESILQNLFETRQDTIKGRNLPNLSMARDEDQEESMHVASNAGHGTYHENDAAACSDTSDISLELLLAERLRDRQITICECHRNEDVSADSVQIEIVLLCVTCQMLFRRFECYNKHISCAKNAVCARNRRSGKTKSKLFCSCCQVILHSLQDMIFHVIMHSKLERYGTVIFICNICKLIFYGFERLFKIHVHNHVRNPFFFANCLSFPKTSCIGPRLVKKSNIDGEKSMEVYLEIADHVCSECGMPFITKEILKSHEEICLNNAVDNTTSSNGTTVSSASPGKMQILHLICGFCNKTFNNEMSFKQHSLDHKQKLEIHAHYTYATGTTATKGYICKVCMIMCASLNKLEEHWLTHGALQEICICTHCKNHFVSVDLFRKHASKYKQPESIQCKIIYRDVRDNRDFKTFLRKYFAIDSNSIPCMNLDSFVKKALAERTTGNESLGSEELATNESNRSARIDKTVKSSKCLKNNLQVVNKDKERKLSTDEQLQRTIETDNGISAEDRSKNNDTMASANNEDDLGTLEVPEESEEEDLVIEVSESEESSSEIRKKSENVPSVNDTQRDTTSPSLIVVVDNEQCPRDACSLTTVSAKNFSDTNDSSKSNSNDRITNGSTLNSNDEASVSDRNDNSKNAAQNNKDAVSADSLTKVSNTTDRSNSVKESLPVNAMNVIPKSFLRVKSLSELMENPSHQEQAPLKPIACKKPNCSQSFIEVKEWIEHMVQHEYGKNQEIKQDKQTPSSSNNVETLLQNPHFKNAVQVPTVNVATLSIPSLPVATSSIPSLPVATSSIPSLSVATSSIPSIPVATSSIPSIPVATLSIPSILLATSSMPSVPVATSSMPSVPVAIGSMPSVPVAIGSMPSVPVAIGSMPSVPVATGSMPSVAVATSSMPSMPVQYNTNVIQNHLILPKRVDKTSLVKLSKPNNPVNTKQYQVVGVKYQFNKVVDPTETMQLQKQLEQQQQQLQQQQQQKHVMVIPSHMAYSTTQSQQLTQGQIQPSLRTVRITKPGRLIQVNQQNTCTTTVMPLIGSPSVQQPLGTPQRCIVRHEVYQSSRQQQQVGIRGNLFNKYRLPSPASLQQPVMEGHQLSPANNNSPNNAILVNQTQSNVNTPTVNTTVNTMRQVSNDPNRYMCLFCPGFECSSLQDFTVHERSPKHEARSHYNGVSWP